MSKRSHEFSTHSKLLAAGLSLIATAGLAGCGLRHNDTAPNPSASASTGSAETAGPGMERIAASTVLHDLGMLAVKGRAPMTGYSRTQFGNGWAGVNGCDERDNILRRDLTQKVLDSRGCEVLSGVLQDPYTGKQINFKRGEGTSLAIQIDHVVALGDAWQTGAQQLSAAEREKLANDPLELRAVDGPANEQKGDADAASWLPPNKSDRCDYVGQQIEVKKEYDLWVTPAEQAAMQGVLASCAGQELVIPQS